ncbi:MAG: hypothetical protein JNJ61_07800 [Anaerolineae bacterium]|nr:hypothetical protein [Anaerolineae bacterium]
MIGYQTDLADKYLISVLTPTLEAIFAESATVDAGALLPGSVCPHMTSFRE